MILISEKEKFFDPRKPFQSARPETHEEWQARMGGEVLAVVRSGLYLDFRFLDMALSALTAVRISIPGGMIQHFCRIRLYPVVRVQKENIFTPGGSDSLSNELPT